MASQKEFRVLCYHGVYPDGVNLGRLNSSGKHIKAAMFESQMRMLREKFRPVSMNQIVSALCGVGELPERAVAVTFDDGYENNFTQAVPILKKYDIPATFYLTTGFIGSEKLMWTDLLEAALFAEKSRQFTLKSSGKEYVFDLDAEATRETVLRSIKKLCKALPSEELIELRETLSADSKIEESLRSAIYGFMSWEQGRAIASCDLFSVGAHTVDHVSLAKARQETALHQVHSSVQTVTEQLETPCLHFAYPEGQESDINDYAKEIVKSAGVICAPSAISGSNALASSDPFFLKREMVGFEGRGFLIP